MELNKKLIKRSTEPYIKEVFYCLIIDIAVVVIGIAVFLVIDILKYAPQLFFIFPCYFAIECLLNYRIFILANIENKRSNYIQKTLSIINIESESSWSGWLWNSAIGKLYPKNLGVERQKIICKQLDGKTLILRSAMSGKKAQKMIDLFINNDYGEVIITYGKYTKIIYKYDLVNKKQKLKQQNEATILNYLF